MSVLSVSLNDHFHLDGKKFLIPNFLKNRLESSLNNKFFTDTQVRRSLSDQRLDGAARLEFHSKGVEIQAEGRRAWVGVYSEPVQKQVDRIVRYARHVGIIDREKLLPSSNSTKVVESLTAQSTPTLQSKTLSLADFSVSAMSLARYSYVVITRGARSSIFRYIAQATGVLEFGLAIQDMRTGQSEQATAVRIGDGEGYRRARAKMVGLGGVVVGSVATTVKTVVSFAAPFFESLASSAYGVASAVGVAMATLGLVRCSNFNTLLQEYLDQPHLSPRIKIEGAVRFLRDSLVVTEQERDRLVEEVEKESPEASKEEKETRLKEKLLHLSEAKLKWFKRRSTMNGVKLILEQADQILERIGSSDPAERREGIASAEQIVGQIQDEIGKKKMVHVINLIAALIGLSGILISMTTPLGMVPYFFYLTSTTVYLGMAAADYLFTRFRRDADAPLPSLPPLYIN